MGVKDLITLVNFQVKNDKLINVTKTGSNGDSSEQIGSVRSMSIDFSPRKAFALLGLYIGVINANAPTVFLNIVNAFIGG